MARKIFDAPEDFKIPEFKEVEELLRQGGNMATFLEHTRDVYLAKVEAERDAIRTKALMEGRTEA